MGWLNKRLPVSEFFKSQLLDYYAPKNFNIWYFFGSLALLVLVMQLVSGIFLTMFYKVGETTAFELLHRIPAEDQVKDFLVVEIAKHNRRPPADWDGVIQLANK